MYFLDISFWLALYAAAPATDVFGIVIVSLICMFVSL